MPQRARKDSVHPRLLSGSYRRPLNLTVRQHAMALSRDRLVWNRALFDAGGPSPGPGDTALASLMRFHGLAMNGGIAHALEVLSPAECDAAIAGFRYFDLTEVASVLAAARFACHDESKLEKLEQHYGTLVPADAVLAAAFEKCYSRSFQDFAPL